MSTLHHRWTGKHYAEQEKPVTKDHELYDSTSKKEPSLQRQRGGP